MNNTKKYGTPKNDIISQMFAISYEHGEGFCKGNILKYITRHKNVSKMPFFQRIYYKMCGKGTKADLVKANDFHIRLRKETKGHERRLALEIWWFELK